MENQKITFQFADIGHWLARCNHQTNVIELNANEWDSLSPLMKEYIWIHECVHLLTDITDEAECNRMSDEIFIHRSRNARDRQQRLDFVAAANDRSFTRVTSPTTDKAPWLLAALVIAAILLTKK
ncbi:MAG: hypothetical protein UHK44_07730 [Bacteroidaceae bacterium]|nr:hypothetical protein [Bacteroidaceae bacterium]